MSGGLAAHGHYFRAGEKNDVAYRFLVSEGNGGVVAIRGALSA